MREYTTQEGYKIYAFANAIPKDICEKWMQRYQEGENNAVYDNKEISDELFTLLNKSIKMPFALKEYQSHVSFVRLDTPIYTHYDSIYGKETHKVVFYLNEVEHGGTEFRSGDDWILVEAHEGTIVIFDIRIQHRGEQEQAKKVKYIMGMRLVEER